jgi:ubiquitin-like protein Pup
MGADLPLSGLPGPTRERGPPFRQAVRLAERSPARSGRRGAYALRLIVSCDEIDSLSKENAEEFVQGYVQKGGE